MISSLRLRFGRSPGAPNDSITVSPITVFVGPNNSGKSKLLSEIEWVCRRGDDRTGCVILDTLDFIPLTAEEAPNAVLHLRQEARLHETVHAGHVIVGKRGE